MTELAVVLVNDSSSRNITGVIVYDRTNGGKFVGPAGAGFPASPTAGEWFWDTGTGTLYRRNDLNTTWDPVQVAAGSIDHGLLAGLGDDDHPQYRNGTLSYTGVLNMSGNRIDNIGGVRVHGALAAPPGIPTPADGDLYYDTVLSEWVFYDGGRSKWLSVAVSTALFGRNGNTAAGQGYRMINGLVVAANRGIPVPTGTLISAAITQETAIASTLDIFANNASIATLAHAAAGTTLDETVNADFAQGFLQARNAPGGLTTSNVQIVLEYRRRP